MEHEANGHVTAESLDKEVVAVLDALRQQGERLERLEQGLDSIKASVDALVQQRTVKDWYSTEEIAGLLGRVEFTVREWCRLGRIHAEKKGSGRGAYPSWAISHAELLRYQREGLLPARNGPPWT